MISKIIKVRRETLQNSSPQSDGQQTFSSELNANTELYLPSYFFKMVFLVLRYNGHFLLYAMVIDASAKDRMDCTTSLETEGILTYQMQPDSNKTKNYVLHPCLTRNTRKTGNWLAGFSLLPVLYD
jgi:hypothetical protein